jgi:ferredoxin
MAKLIFLMVMIGVHTSMANLCGPGTTDDDADPSTVCAACVAGRYSDAADAVGACAGVCPLGSFSGACAFIRRQTTLQVHDFKASV